MTTVDDEKYPFNYWKRILFKQAVGIGYRNYVNNDGLFFGLHTNRCDECMVEGYILPFYMPFKFGDISIEECEHILFSMGIRKIENKELKVMPQIIEHEDGNFCKDCLEKHKEDTDES